jgi:hypothetical protein
MKPHKRSKLPEVGMESWMAVCGLFAAVVNMILDVAQFWKEVRFSRILHGLFVGWAEEANVV